VRITTKIGFRWFSILRFDILVAFDAGVGALALTKWGSLGGILCLDLPFLDCLILPNRKKNEGRVRVRVMP
jgi:hypothetical protein